MRNEINKSYDNVKPDKMTTNRMYRNIINKSKSQRRNNRVLKTVLVTACLLVAVILSIQITSLINKNHNNTINLAYPTPTSCNEVAYRIILSINPSVEFSVDKDDYIVEVVGMNEDGEDLIDGIDFAGLSLENATIVVVNQLLKHGYISAASIQNEIQLFFSENIGNLETLDIMSNIVEAAAGQYDIRLTKEKLNNNRLQIYLGSNNNDNEETVDASNVSSLTFEYLLEEGEYVGNVYIYPDSDERFSDFIDFAGMSINQATLWGFQELYYKNYIRDDVTLTYVIDGLDTEQMQSIEEFIKLLIEEKGLALTVKYSDGNQIVVNPTSEGINAPNNQYTIKQLCDSQLIKDKSDATQLQIEILEMVYTQEEIDWFFTPRYWAVVPNFIGLEKDKALELLELTGFEVQLDEFEDERSEYREDQINTVVYQDTDAGGTWEVGSRFMLSVLIGVSETKTPIENDNNTDNEVEPEVQNISEGTFSDIAGVNFIEGIRSAKVIDIKKGTNFDIVNEGIDINKLGDLIDTLYFKTISGNMIWGEKYLYQIKLSDDKMAYFIDIYLDKDSYLAVLNNAWIGEDDAIVGRMVSLIEDYLAQSDVNNSSNLTDDEIIGTVLDRINLSLESVPNGIDAGRYYICDERFRVDHWDSDFAEVNGYNEVEISLEQLNEILVGIQTSAMASLTQRLCVPEDDVVINTEFRIFAEYEDYVLQLFADDNTLYVRTKIDNDYYMTKVKDNRLYKKYILMLGDDTGFSFNDIVDTEAISILYIEDKYKKDYPENGKLTEIKITDKDIINRIIETIVSNATPTISHPSRENTDMIFHTPNGDIYCKIKCPFSKEADEGGFEWILTEPTIIMEGYYWYDCPEIYRILRDINK